MPPLIVPPEGLLLPLAGPVISAPPSLAVIPVVTAPPAGPRSIPPMLVPPAEAGPPTTTAQAPPSPTTTIAPSPLPVTPASQSRPVRFGVTPLAGSDSAPLGYVVVSSATAPPTSSPTPTAPIPPTLPAPKLVPPAPPPAPIAATQVAVIPIASDSRATVQPSPVALSTGRPTVSQFPAIVIRPVTELRTAPVLPVAGETPLPPPDGASAISASPKTYTFVAASGPPPAPHPQADAVVVAALAKVGIPYLWGGETDAGYDCSGLSKVAWQAAGVNIVHQSTVQFNQTVRINLADIAPGDLLFFGDPIHHLGIYVGDGKMVEAPKPGMSVRVVSIKRRDLVGIGRITG